MYTVWQCMMLRKLCCSIYMQWWYIVDLIRYGMTQCDTILNNMILCNTICYGMMWYMNWSEQTWCDIWYDTIRDNIIWYDEIWNRLIWYGMAWYDMVWYGMAWQDVIWYNMVWGEVVRSGLACYGIVRYDMIFRRFYYTIHFIIWEHMIWHGTILCSLIWYGPWHYAKQCNGTNNIISDKVALTTCNIVQHSIVQHSTVQYNTVSYNMFIT